MSSNRKSRRGFLKKALSVAGVSAVPGSFNLMAKPAPAPHRIVEFITRFPKTLSLEDYRNHKSGFENKDKVTTLVSVFKKNGKMINEQFSFHGSHARWRVEFLSDEVFKEWMTLTEELESHKDLDRENAGFDLEIRIIA